MKMKISIICVLALLATSISAVEVPDYGLYSAGEGTPIFAFQPILKNSQREKTHGFGDRGKSTDETSNIIEDIQEEEENDDDDPIRIKREAYPGEDEGKGGVEVDVNRERGQGTIVDASVSRKVWESQDGRGRVDVHGNYGRTYGGTGRPNYGGRITYSHRFRREANSGDEQNRGRVEVDVNRERGQGTRVDVTASGKVWESRDGNGRVDVHGNYGRTYGGPGGTGRPTYGGGITYSHRFRRSLQPRGEDKRGSGGNQDQGRGNIDVNIDRQRGQGTRVDVSGSGRVWESRDGNGRVDVHGNYGRTYGGPGGTGRPNYGGRITYSHRFRREANPADEQNRGRVEVDVNRERSQGTRVDVTASGKVWESRDGNGRVDVHGNYGRTYGGPVGTGRPNYGGRITYSHRFRREAVADGGQDEGFVEVNNYEQESEELKENDAGRAKRAANPRDEDRGRVEVDINRERGQGTRVDARATGKVWESRDGNGRVEVGGNYGRTYGGPRGTGRPDYGGRITYSHRFRRSLQPVDDEITESSDEEEIHPIEYFSNMQSATEIGEDSANWEEGMEPGDGKLVRKTRGLRKLHRRIKNAAKKLGKQVEHATKEAIPGILSSAIPAIAGKVIAG